MKDLVSIVIPTYKRNDMLMTAIKSCLRQTYQNIEIIVVNDNIKGNKYYKKTLELMETIKSEKVRLINNEVNQGGVLARNKGIENANGKYIVFLDDDDEFILNRIELQLTLMKREGLDASFANCIVKEADTDDILKHISHPKWKDYSDPLIYHIVEMIYATHTFMIKKEVLESIGGFPQSLAGHEYLLMLRILEEGYKVGHLDSDVAIVYIHPGIRISTSRNKAKAEKILFDIKKKHFDKLDFNQKQYVRYRYYYNLIMYYIKANPIFALYYAVLMLVLHPLIVLSKIRDKIWTRK